MGISRFYSYLFKNYPNIHQECEKNQLFQHTIDVLAIDLNNILHMCAQQVFEYGSYGHMKRFLTKKNANKYDYFRQVCVIIDSIIEYVKPSKKILLCIDGVGSMAKIKQQRTRRYKCLLDFKELPDATTESSLKFNPNELSPGTMLMDELSKYINWHIHYSLSNNKHWKNLTIVFSNEKVPGEGEHKIFTLMRELFTEHGKFSYCIYGIDADLIMLSLLNLKFCSNLYLLRENLFNDNFICIPINSLFDQIISEFSTYVDNFKDTDKIRLIYDYVLIFFFFGNDFLPEIPSVDIEFNSIIFNEYKVILSKYGYLTEKEDDMITFNNTNFKEFLYACSLIESDLLFQKSQEEFFPSTILINSIENNETVNMLKFNKSYNETKLLNTPKITLDYFTTCIWNINYYIGNNINWNWKYSSYYSPTFTQMFYLFDFFTSPKYVPSAPIPPFLQLLFLIPFHQKYILPSALQDLIPIINPNEITIDFTMKRSDRESVTIIPNINEDEIQKQYFKRKQLFYGEDRNSHGKNIYYYSSNSTFYYNSKWKDIPNCNVVKVFKN